MNKGCLIKALIAIATAVAAILGFCVLLLSSCAGPIPMASMGKERRLMTEYLEDKYAKEFSVDRPKVSLEYWGHYYWSIVANARDKSDPPIEFMVSGGHGKYGDKYASNYSDVIMTEYFKDELEKNGFDFEIVRSEVYYNDPEKYSINYRALTPENILKDNQICIYVSAHFEGNADLERAEAILLLVNLLRSYEMGGGGLYAVILVDDLNAYGKHIEVSEFETLIDAQSVLDFLVTEANYFERRKTSN